MTIVPYLTFSNEIATRSNNQRPIEHCLKGECNRVQISY